MRSLVLGLSLTLALPSAAAANDTAANQERQAKPQKERLICKREEATASRTASTRRCLTAEQWSAEARGAGDVQAEIGGRSRAQ